MTPDAVKVVTFQCSGKLQYRLTKEFEAPDDCSCRINMKGYDQMESEYTRKVVVTDIKMSFGSMVVFMVKWAIATIPAFIILAAAGTIIFAVIGAISGSFNFSIRV